MNIKFNDFHKQYLAQKLAYNKALTGVLESGYYILGSQVASFEKSLASYLGVKYIVGVANGLEALQLSLMALNIGPGDEVITTCQSAVATALAIKAVGATPVFVDIDEYVYSTRDNHFVDTLRKDYGQANISAIGIHWLLFGDNYHKDFSPEPVYNRFTRRALKINHHIKSVARLKEVISFRTPHSFITQNNTIDEHFNIIPNGDPWYEPATADILRCNHYMTNTKAECFKRREGKTRVDVKEIITGTEEYFLLNNKNEVEDNDIWKVL